MDTIFLLLAFESASFFTLLVFSLLRGITALSAKR
jgi:hypothetical protein